MERSVSCSPLITPPSLAGAGKRSSNLFVAVMVALQIARRTRRSHLAVARHLRANLFLGGRNRLSGHLQRTQCRTPGKNTVNVLPSHPSPILSENSSMKDGRN